MSEKKSEAKKPEFNKPESKASKLDGASATASVKVEEKKDEAQPKLADATPATVSEVLGQMAPYAKEGETLKQAFSRVLKEYDAYKGAAKK